MANLKFDPRANVIAYLNNRDPKSAGFKDAIWCLKSSQIHYPISDLPVIDGRQTRAFWQAVDFDLKKEPPVITAVVELEHISNTIGTIAKALKLDDDVVILVLLNEDDVFARFKSMGYEG